MVPIVLLHGMWAADWCFKYWVECLVSQGYKVYVINLPGHGGSETTKPLGHYSMDDFVQAVWSVIVKLPEEAFHLIGHSMGGLIAMKLVELQATFRLRRLVIAKVVSLMGAPPAWVRLRGKVLRRLLKPRRYLKPILCAGTFTPTKRDAFDLILNHSLEGHRTEIWEQMKPESGLATRDILCFQCSVNVRLLKQSPLPILVVAGKYDELITEEVQRTIYRKYLPVGQTDFMLAPHGHMAMMEKGKTLLLRQITTWLQK